MADDNSKVPEDLTPLTSPVSYLQVVLLAGVLVALYLISTANYLLFHGIVELAGIAVAFSIFIIVWNTRRVITDGFFLIIGISFLFFGSIDLVHTLAYKGMGIFPGNSSDLPTQLWIAARYFQSIAFLAATLFIGRSITKDRKYDAGIIIAICTAACAILFSSIFVWQNFPACYVEGTGLTLFKITSEYIISLILIATIVILYMKREHFDPVVWKLIIAAQVFLVLGELAFSSYASVFGFMNMLGHLFRLISVYLFYRAFVVVALTRPYHLLLRELKQNEVTLRAGEKKYRTLFENMLEGFAYCRMIYDVEGRPVDWTYLDVNTAFERMTGLKNIAGKRVLEVIPDIRTLTPELFNTYGRVASTGKPEIFEIDFKPMGMWLKISVFSPETGYFVAVFEDMTTRKIVEGALRESREMYRELVENISDVIFSLDLQGNFTYISPAIERQYGYTNEEIIGKNFSKFVYQGDHTACLEAFRKRLDGEYGPSEFRVVTKEGRIQNVIVSQHPIFSKNGTVAGFNYIMTNITERKIAEDEVRKARDFYLSVLNDFPNPIWRAGVDGKCNYFNKDWLAFTGRNLEQELGDGWAEGVHPDDLDRCLKIYLENFNARKPFDMEYRLRYHDGTYRWLYDSGKPISSQNGEFVGYIGSCYDIHDRKLAEDALRQANTKLNLLSSITRHDINNQLFSLKAFLELSKETLNDPATLSEYILKEERAANAIERQIVFTKEYQDLGANVPTWQNVGAGIKNALALLPVRDIRISEDVDAVEVYADPLFEKVFYNLIDNALRYGGPAMTMIRITSQESGPGLILSIEDDGAGISAHDRMRIFERGFGHNTGLGLFLCREILAITGITITETGEPGKGARFEITVPKGGYRFTGERT
ncbi:MASE3 domain-containing protein [Methanoregula sp.]|uniref:sensor histidine kinase n=1 Tax=Methanoregula sp. TaxID=2052170 RepID=UPI0035669E9D